MDGQERKILTAGELKQMFQDPSFAKWANDLDRRADEYAAYEKAMEGTRGISARNTSRFLRNEY